MKAEIWETMDMYVVYCDYGEGKPIELCRTKQMAIAHAKKYARQTEYIYSVFPINFHYKINLSDLYLENNPIFITNEEGF